MTKAALREKRRQERLARRNRNRIIYGVIAVVLVAALAYLIFNEQVNKPTTSEGIASGCSASDAAVTTASVLIYDDLVGGTGTAAKSGDTVSVTYTGYVTDGTVFDSNVDSGQPFEFQLGAGYVIPGWDEGLVGMQVVERVRQRLDRFADETLGTLDAHGEPCRRRCRRAPSPPAQRDAPPDAAAGQYSELSPLNASRAGRADCEDRPPGGRESPDRGRAA